MIDNAAIDFYGADWCGDCHRAKAALDRFGVAYSLHDIEHEDGAAEKAIAISGQQHIPVIRFADGSWLVEPSATQLQAKCKELGLIGFNIAYAISRVGQGELSPVRLVDVCGSASGRSMSGFRMDFAQLADIVCT